MIPSFENLSTSLNAHLTPFTYVLDIEGDSAFCRFLGTGMVDRWKVDFTGGDLMAMFAEDARVNILSNFRNVVEHRCGFVGDLIAVLEGRAAVAEDMIQLPLSIKPERPPSVIGFANRNKDREGPDAYEEVASTNRGEWIDLGNGVPSNPPYVFKNSQHLFSVER